MCGRCITLTYDEVMDVIHQIEVGLSIQVEPDWPAQYPQAYPKSRVPLILSEGAPDFGAPESSAPQPNQQLRLFAEEKTWGFEESWKNGVVFNTRIESADKPMWRESLAHRRCVICARGFFETHATETVPSPKTGRMIKAQYEFNVPDQSILFIGGIWKEDRFSMVTTQANADMVPIHHRMPLVLRPAELASWFGPEYLRLADRSAIPLEAHRA
ncbi:SOS response-associated peptidase family protein [Eggerthellaceae bacterium 3-80]